MNLRRYSANSCDVVLPLAELEPEDANVHRFAVSYQVEEEAQEAFEAAVKAYTDEHTTMGYTTKESLRREFANMVTVIATIGISLAAVIALIGILNFVSYIALSGVIGFLAGSLLSFLVLRALNNVLLFFEYHFQILPFVIMMPVFLVTAVLAPVAAYRNVRKKSIVERLRESEQA